MDPENQKKRVAELILDPASDLDYVISSNLDVQIGPNVSGFSIFLQDIHLSALKLHKKLIGKL